jgi:1,4-dihydroxy-2-naphthoate polyprenyltransferase
VRKELFWAWYQASRPPFFIATLIPLALGGVVAFQQGTWDTVRWTAVLVASFLVHLSTNLANDYFDYLSGADGGDSLGGSRVIQDGKITLSQLRTALFLLYTMALLCGVWIIWVSKVWWLIMLMLFSFFSSLFYTAPPIRYGYLGLGELFVALNMGPVMVVGTSAALAGHFVPQSFWLSLPVAFMVALILYYQSLSDIEADEAVGKYTVAVRLGQAGALWGYRALVLATFASIALLVFRGFLPDITLLSLAGIYQAYRVDSMIRNSKDWKDLHDRGGGVRLLYLSVGLILILSKAFCG